MKFTFINENIGLISKKDIRINEKYDMRELILKMFDVRNAKDFIDFIYKAPYSFFSKFFFDLARQEESLEEYLPRKTDYFFKGTIENAVQRRFIELDYLDELLIREGVLGQTATKQTEYGIQEIVQLNGKYEFIYLSTIEEFIRNAQQLLGCVAIAATDISSGYFERQSIGRKTNAQIIESNISAYPDFHSDNERDSALSWIFDRKEIETLRKAVVPLGYEIQGTDIHSQHSYLNKPFVVRSTMSDSEVAAFIFTWFMNTLFEGNYEAYYSSNTFKVEFERGRFRLHEARNPIQEFYYEIAKLAESGTVKLCANCKQPFVDDRSRGNEALYCSRSCNTQASNKRKELARQYKSAGIPVEKAIEKIGNKYEKSIRSWYQDNFDSAEFR